MSRAFFEHDTPTSLEAFERAQTLLAERYVVDAPLARKLSTILFETFVRASRNGETATEDAADTIAKRSVDRLLGLVVSDHETSRDIEGVDSSRQVISPAPASPVATASPAPPHLETDVSGGPRRRGPADRGASIWYSLAQKETLSMLSGLLIAIGFVVLLDYGLSAFSKHLPP